MLLPKNKVSQQAQVSCRPKRNVKLGQALATSYDAIGKLPVENALHNPNFLVMREIHILDKFLDISMWHILCHQHDAIWVYLFT